MNLQLEIFLKSRVYCKTFLFFKIESWNFQVQFEIEFRETSQNFNSFSLFRQLLFSSFFIGCLIVLKFREVSGNSISNWTWKFQLSILKNKKKIGRCQYQNLKALFTDSIFQKVLVSPSSRDQYPPGIRFLVWTVRDSLLPRSPSLVEVGGEGGRPWS